MYVFKNLCREWNFPEYEEGKCAKMLRGLNYHKLNSCNEKLYYIVLHLLVFFC